MRPITTHISHFLYQMSASADHDEQKDGVDPLGNVYGFITSFLKDNVPGWDTPCMLVPTAKVYEKSSVLLAKSVAGDQIAVQSSSGYWHHGIYLGLRKKDSVESVWIIDVWGETKESSTISVRDFEDFVRGGAKFAVIEYGDNAEIRKKHDSAKLAIATMIEAKKNGFIYNAVSNNCEHFATACRTYRWDAIALHADVACELPQEVPTFAIPSCMPKLSSDLTLTHVVRTLNMFQEE